ncbi:procathepsin L-like [Zerene cesonia]|uniref:procathepsin L-like n=1 Tax=Zerene cesonia TaxID=33412 RepID=UPI0018E568A0|nr:procathepsin L-like [Zerene cesonia]
MYLILLKLILLQTALHASGSTVNNDEDLPKLKWSSTYSLEGERWSLTGGWIEDFKFWRTTKKSRADFNNGAVKLFNFRGKRRSAYKFGVEFTINPITTKEAEIKLNCTKREGDILHRISLHKLLPDVHDFEYVGKEDTQVPNVHKFVHESDEENDYTKRILIAHLIENKTWIPIKLEEIEFNDWLGRLTKHLVWHYYNFKTVVDEKVFSVDEYPCESHKQPSKLNEVTITKDLSFSHTNDEEHVARIFKSFTQKHRRVYKDENEHEMRKAIFHKNMRRIIANNNNNNSGFKLGVTKFADRTPEEMKRMKGLLKRKQGEVGTVPFAYTPSQIKELSKSLPETFDHRLYGRITPVNEQEDCGSCWTFGTTAAVEGALARANGGRLIRLSNQALIDCAWEFGAQGCDGGTDVVAYKWMMKYGLPTEEEYGSYENKDGFCRISNMTNLYTIQGFVDVTPFSVEALKVALVYHGPLSVSMDATDLLSLYTQGIFYDPYCTNTDLNHEVTLVGYGVNDGEEYWIVKNSWGPYWGMDGYFHISQDNNCGITTEPTYVVF